MVSAVLANVSVTCDSRNMLISLRIWYPLKKWYIEFLRTFCCFSLVPQNIAVDCLILADILDPKGRKMGSCEFLTEE